MTAQEGTVPEHAVHLGDGFFIPTQTSPFWDNKNWWQWQWYSLWPKDLLRWFLCDWAALHLNETERLLGIAETMESVSDTHIEIEGKKYLVNQLCRNKIALARRLVELIRHWLTTYHEEARAVLARKKEHDFICGVSEVVSGDSNATALRLGCLADGAEWQCHQPEIVDWKGEVWEALMFNHERGLFPYGTTYRAGWRVISSALHRTILPADHKERTWAIARLRYLCLVWATCGERSAWLLHENKCPLEFHFDWIRGESR